MWNKTNYLKVLNSNFSVLWVQETELSLPPALEMWSQVSRLLHNVFQCNYVQSDI